MTLGPHLVLSSAVGVAVWAASGEVNALPAAIAAGVLPDGDHLLDYYFRFIRRDTRHLFLLLHGWEYLLIGILVYLFAVREPWMLAIVLGYATQIGADQFANANVRWNTYSLLARAAVGFNSVRIVGHEQRHAYRSFVASVPFGKERLTRWFESRSH